MLIASEEVQLLKLAQDHYRLHLMVFVFYFFFFLCNVSLNVLFLYSRILVMLQNLYICVAGCWFLCSKEKRIPCTHFTEEK